MKPPKHVYSQTMAVNVCTQIDRWQAPTVDTTQVSHVNFQRVHETILSNDGTQVRTNALVFVDADYSTPALDYWELQRTSEANGQPLTVTYDGDLYEVLSVDCVINQRGALDHWELTLK